ncbi:MAG: glycosyltransferase [Candidatus Moranbacteria bacterium]|nr:glycosyltransferase [Candidatus Moranbacteria bacterium]
MSSTNPKKTKNLKIALVHDFLIYQGGAEKVLETLCEIFPEAPIYTLLYDEKNMKKMFEDKKIHTSFLQKFPKFIRKHHRWLLPFYASAVETYNLRDFDLVISSSGAWSKGIVTRVDTKHIAYIHSPMRFIWDENEKYLKRNKNFKSNFIVRQILSYLRIWDAQASKRPDFLIANSKYTQARISKYYRRDSEIIYPPVEFVENYFDEQGVMTPCSEKGGCGKNSKKPFMIISRLSTYKNVVLTVKAFNKLNLPLIVIGDGEERKHLEKIAGKNIQILGWVDEKVKQKILNNSRAFIFPSEDDFGIVCVEALNARLPVIALRKGGAREIVQEGVTGEFFNAPTVEVLADGVRRFLDNENFYDKNIIKKSAEKFDKDVFKDRILEFVEEKIKF